MAKKKADKPTALGIDIFAGLFTVGVKQAGFNVLGHLEHGKYGVKTAAANWPDMPIAVGIENWNLPKLRNKVDFLYSNPPCAAWSTMNHTAMRTWHEQIERLQFVRDGVNAAKEIAPEAWCWESVPNAWRHGRAFVLELAEDLCSAGYHVTLLLQNNKYMGVPQDRKRVFLIGHKRPLMWPRFTRVSTVAETLALIPKKLPKPPVSKPNDPLYRGWDKLWKACPRHKYNLYDTFNAMGRPDWMRKPIAIVKRLKPDVPAPVMLSSFSRLHPHEPRELTWYEWLALCGLPMNFKTGATGWDASTRELARAVMPPVGKWLGRSVLEGLSERPIRGRPTIRIVDHTDPKNIREELLWTLGDHPHERMQKYEPPPFDPDAPKVSKQACPPKAPPKVGDRARKGGTVKMRNAPVVRIGSGFRIRQMLVKGMQADAILAVIHKEFPGSKATNSDISWNRGKLRAQGGVP